MDARRRTGLMAAVVVLVAGLAVAWRTLRIRDDGALVSAERSTPSASSIEAAREVLDADQSDSPAERVIAKAKGRDEVDPQRVAAAHALFGRVSWPDGRPASGAEVCASSLHGG